MRIPYLKLVGYKGISDGLKLREIELDLTSCPYREILLLGGNGRGKSTIRSALQPYAETFDNRPSPIVEGEEGYKEIHYEMEDGRYYVIKHFYVKGSIKSYIYRRKPGAEDFESINESGGVRTFKSTIEEEFKVTPNFFSLVQLGSNLVNFVDMASAARKTFIGSFMPSIEEWLTHYKTVNEKVGLVNKESKFVADELAKFQDIEFVEKNITVRGNELKIHRGRMNTLHGSLGTVREKQRVIAGSIDLDDIQARRKDHALVTKQIAIKTEAIATRLTEIPKLAETDLDQKEITLNAEIAELTQKRAILVTERDGSSNQISGLSNQLKNAQAEVQRFTNGKKVDVDSLKQLLVTYGDEIVATTAKINGNEGLQQLAKLFSSKKKATVVDAITSYSRVLEIKGYTPARILPTTANIDRLIESILEKRQEESVAAIHTLISDNSLNFHEDMVSTDGMREFTNTYFGEVKKDLAKANATLTRLTAELAEAREAVVAQSARNDVAQLCVSKTCAVFKIKAEFSTLSDRVTAIENELEVCKKDKAFAEEILGGGVAEKDWTQYVQTLSQLINILLLDDGVSPLVFRLAEIQELVANAAGIPLDDINSVLQFIIDPQFSHRLQDIFGDFANFSTACQQIQTIESLKVSIANTEERIEQYSDSAKAIEALSRNVATLEAQIADIRSQVEVKKAEIETLDKTLTNKRAALQITVDFKELQTSAATLQAQLDVLDAFFAEHQTAIDKIAAYDEEIAVLDRDIEGVQSLIDNAETQLSELQAKQNSYNDYCKRRDSVLERRTKYMAIRDALDIKSGIPLVLINQYISDIRIGANQLLRKAFNGSFIVDFSITDKEFLIPVYKNGDETKDILFCSQGEVALTKTALSMGIANRALKSTGTEYNIVSLDEIDGELDTKNRSIFLDILKTQLNLLKSEQCFIITHNDAFARSSVGLILLPDANVDTDDEMFMQNKHVVADFRNCHD